MQKLNIQNPKFNFTETQTRDILAAAYHLSKASEHLMEANGMLGLLYNSQAIELLDQAGLSQAFLDELGYTKTMEPKIQLSEEESKEVDDLFNEILNAGASTKNAPSLDMETPHQTPECDCKQ